MNRRRHSCCSEWQQRARKWPKTTDESDVKDICVIFDLDGTLVDSETLCNQAFLDLLPQLAEPVEALVDRYRGRRLATIFADIESRLTTTLPPDFEPRYRSRVAELMERELKPMPGVATMLEGLPYPKCIASSGPPTKISHALDISGLRSHFGDRCFSSHTVGSWKPEPDLFLHAAKAMGFAPSQCVVVEDSEVGIEAAVRAGMRAFHYRPSDTLSTREGVTPFNDMLQLARHIDDLVSRAARR
jgi:HAD superfamily hydrolase (TIGR01509 family)